MEEVLHLKWNNYGSSVLTELSDFLKQERLCDSTLTCQGKYYPVHRLVLSLSSEYFEQIYERTPCKHPYLILHNIEPSHLEAILTFIYQGEVQVTHDIFPQFIKVAETLKIKGLISNHNRSNSNSGLQSKRVGACGSSTVVSSADSGCDDDVIADFIQYPNELSCKKQIAADNKKILSVILDPVIPVRKLNISEEFFHNTRSSLQTPCIKFNQKRLKCRKSRRKIIAKTGIVKSPFGKLKYSADETNTLKSSSSSSADNGKIEDLNTEEKLICEKSLSDNNEVDDYNSNMKAKEDCLLKDLENQDCNLQNTDVTFSLTKHLENYECAASNNDMGGYHSENVEHQEYNVDNIDDGDHHQSENLEVGSEQRSRIMIVSYSGGSYKEFEDNPSANDVIKDGIPDMTENEENIFDIKLEPIDFSVDGNGFLEKNELGARYGINSENLKTENAVVLPNGKMYEKIPYHEPYSTDSASNLEKVGSCDTSTLAGDHSKSYSRTKQCRFCPYSTSVMVFIKAHEYAHSCETSYKCKFCWYRSVSKANVEIHERSTHTGKKRKRGQRKKRKTIIRSKKGKSGLYCIKEGAAKVYEGNISLLKNYNESVKVGFDSNDKGKEGIILNSLKENCVLTPKLFKCNHCTYSTNHKGYLRLHQRAHRNKTLTCGKCLFKASSKYGLKKHEMKYHFSTKSTCEGKEERMLKCQYCSYSTVIKTDLCMHEISHTFVNCSYRCSFCPFKSMRQSSVKAHEFRNHNKEKLLKKGLQNGNEELTCRYCSFIARTNICLKKHATVHTGEKLFNCNFCSFQSRFKPSLSRHTVTFHPQASEEKN